MLGVDDPITLISVNNLGGLLMQQGKLEEAEPLCRRALEGSERVFGVEHCNTLNTRGKKFLSLLCPIVFSSFDRPLTHHFLISFTFVLIPLKGNLGLLLMKRDDEEKSECGKGMVRDVLSSLLLPPHSLLKTHRWIQKFQQEKEE